MWMLLLWLFHMMIYLTKREQNINYRSFCQDRALTSSINLFYCANIPCRSPMYH